jgi:hypothetical protein
MKWRARILQNPDRRNAIASAARTITDPPPDWLVAGLEHFSESVGTEGSAKDEEKDAMRIIARMHDAADYLTRFLQFYSHLPLGIRRPDDVAVARRSRRTSWR